MAFTLIELLVVIAIISLLIGILVPTFLRVRDSAQLIQCSSNLSAITKAWHMFLNEHNDRFPRGQYNIHTIYGGKQGQAKGYGGVSDVPTVFSPYPAEVPRLLNPYLSLSTIEGRYPPNTIMKPGETPPMLVGAGVKVFQCPGDSRSFIINVDEVVQSTHFDYYGTSYRTNRYLIGPTPPLSLKFNPCKQGLDALIARFDAYVAPRATQAESNLVLMGDYGFDDWQNPEEINTNSQFHARLDKKSDPYTVRHNIAFLDGHIEFVPIRKGIYVSSNYTVIPFRDLLPTFSQNQRPGPLQ